MSGTSIIIENELSGGGTESVSVRVADKISGSSRAVSSMLETMTRGGLYVPVLLSGPTVSLITTTTARVSWELDPSGPIGYHRVRHRPTAGGDWIVTDWSETPSFSAVVDLSDLAPGTEHDYQVQSCHYGDGTLAFSYYPDPADTFETEVPAGDIVFSDFKVSKNPIFQTAVIAWKTDVLTRDKTRWRIRGSDDAWTYTILDIQFRLNHSDSTTMPCTPGANFEFQAYGITEDLYEEWDIVRYIKISDAGAPKIVD